MFKNWHLLIPIIILTNIVFYGCKKDIVGCVDNVDCGKVTYSGTVSKLIQNDCSSASCHGADFSTYADLKTIADNGDLEVEVVTSENMPSGGITMTCEERTQIECWINAGAPDN